jgi:FtsP/CotA-like multicopper oxidase with cupredoxin domain
MFEQHSQLSLSTIGTRLLLCILAILVNAGAISAQQPHPGRGAMSAQAMAAMARMAHPADAGSSTADSVCSRFTAGSTVAAPPELRSQNGVLEVTLNFLSVTDSEGLARYCYVTDTGLESPTLRVNAGDKLIIHFNNQLPASSDSMAGMNMTLSPKDSGSTGGCGSGTMSAVATNIHFHGTNVAPVCGQDEVVTTLVQPGQSFNYTVQVPLNEPPGLYWYHPHVHGFSEGQVQGGATGAIIVEGLQNVDTALAGLPERTFVLRDLLLPASEANDPNIPAWDLSINYVPVTYPSYTPAVIEATPGEQELWRVANTAADTILNLQYLVSGTAQPMQVVAIDGYPIASGSSGQNLDTETSVLLPPGARAEFVVSTPAVGQRGQLVTDYWNTGPDGDFDPTRTIATVVNGSSSASVTNASASTKAAVTRLPARVTPKKVTRFAALTSATPVAQRNLYFSELLENPSDPNSPTNFFITQEGQQPAVFTMGQAPNIVVHSGTVEDWVVENRAEEDHIFHIHQIHFQVLEVNGVAVTDPAVRDTVDLPYWSGTGAFPSVKVRMDFRDPNIIGTFVYHCHILQHEDAGMMGEIQVLPAGSASAVTASTSAPSTTPNGSLTLTANVTDATTSLPLSTGTVQFELNGNSLGNPVALANGVATLTTTLNGAAGTNNLTAFYQGDSTYTESISPAVPLTISSFALTSAGASAAVGAAVTAPVTVNVADGYTNPITLSCTLPASLKEAACFINPGSITGSGQVSLTVNTTPAHPVASNRAGAAPWFAASGGIGLAGILLFVFPRRAWRNRAVMFLGLVAALFSAIGCGTAAKTDPGTASGTYSVLVMATAGSGSSRYRATTNVPITVE